MVTKMLSGGPPPMRNGRTDTAAAFRYSMTEGTLPVTSTESEANFFTSGSGLRPTMKNLASGILDRTCGQISAQKNRIASTFASQSIDPVNITTLPDGSEEPAPLNSCKLTPVGTTEMIAGVTALINF